jgi:transcriptional regulator with XRE-family HTH domain
MDEKEICQKFGRNVRNFRLSRNWSQEELGHRASLDRTYIGGVERGERNPGLVNIVRIASALNVPVGELFPSSEEDE